MDGFCDLVGTDVAPVSKKAAVKWNSVLPEREIQEMFYWLGGILQNIFISVCTSEKLEIELEKKFGFLNMQEKFENCLSFIWLQDWDLQHRLLVSLPSISV